jgi:saccharopine dehydrogenase-like NADP-dependent oxidoreductase
MLEENEAEVTVMRIIIRGKNKRHEFEEIEYNLYDEYAPETQTSSMARTTGYTATAVANMFLNGLFNERGIIPPEIIGRDEKCFDYIMQYLEKRNVIYRKSVCRCGD